MSKDMLIDSAHAEEIRIAVVDDGKLNKFDFETRSKVQVKGNIYLAKVIRVEPSLQAAFVDYGRNRHGFLSFSEIHYDYFQIPVSDRQELETHLQNAIAAHVAETGQSEEELDSKEIAKLRYQFYRRYKIQEVIKKRQIMLVQVTKEERGNKGAALTTYISLAGRYCVLMPNTPKGSGISRKITNRNDREKLKKIVSELNIENGSTVIRTAGVGHTKTEIKKDFSYLKSTWNEIRETVLKSSAPCLIHEEASIIKRAIRDMYSKEIDSVVVEGEDGYKTAKLFMKRLMPSHSRKVKLYTDKNVPLFSKYKLNEQINQIYSTRVDLPSGGYLVINNTEALISIDVNSGRATKERNISGTALKTNLEAAVEIARQCRLRDLAGLIVVDFIDMEEKRNNAQVERCMRESLKSDKAKIQVGTISNFGLLEFSRQRLRSSIADANMVICPHCHGTGFMWSEESLAIQVLRRIEEACISSEYKEIIITLPTSIALYILNNKRSFISAIESRGNLKITFNIDNRIAANDFRIDQILKPVHSFDAEDDEDVEADNNKTENKENEISKKVVSKKSKVEKADSEKNIEEELPEVKSIPQKKKFNRRPIKNKSEKISENPTQEVAKENSEKNQNEAKKSESGKNNSTSGKNQSKSKRIKLNMKKNPPEIKNDKVNSEQNLSEPKTDEVNSEQSLVEGKKEKPTQQNRKRNPRIKKNNSANLGKENKSEEKSDANEQEGKKDFGTSFEIKEGKVDYDPMLKVSNSQMELVSKVVQSYKEQEIKETNIAPVAPKKKDGWWQKLLKKPEENK